jgi:hypothetical protein
MYGWKITHDPYTIRYEEVTVYADLGAESPIAAEKESDKIVVEVKSFINPSPMSDLKIALGQYEIYKDFLEEIDPKRQLYLAVSSETNNEVFQQKAYQFIIKRHQLPFIIVNIEAEEIVKWTKPLNTVA